MKSQEEVRGEVEKLNQIIVNLMEQGRAREARQVAKTFNFRILYGSEKK